MKTKSTYLFFISLFSLICAIGLVFYIATGIKNKTETIKTHYQQDFKNKNIELGGKIKKDAVTLTEEQIKVIAKECTLAHLAFFKSPFEQLSQQKIDGLNGAATEKLKMVTEYWKGMTTYIENI